MGHLSAIALAATLAASPCAPLCAPLRAQPATDSLAPAARAARIEHDLRPLVQVRGRPVARATLEARMRALGVPAVGVAVVDGGRVAWSRAYGMADVAHGQRATTSTLFQAASMSKPVAATAALQLVAEGKLTLDGDVNAVLKSWRVPASPASGGKPVTLRQLLTHSAGLTVHGFPGYAADSAVPTVVQVLDGAPPANTAPVRVDTVPGSRWRYSGGGMTVMQLLLTDVTGKPFETLLDERVLEPAGMRRSTFAQPLPDVFAAEAATGYRRGGGAVPGRFHTYPEMAAAGLWTTPGDLARWIVAIQRAHAGAVAPSVALLPRRLAVAMLTPGIGNWGLGVGIEGEGDARRFVHGGANEGFRGLFAGYVTGGRGVVVMTNSDVGGPIAAEMVAAVAREYGWPGYEQREIVALALDSARAAEYLGRFGRPGGAAVLTIERAGEDLAVVGPAGVRWELVATGADAFVLLPDGAPARFERDSTGRVTAVVVGTSDRLTRVP